MNQTEEQDFCDCCMFGNHTSPCVCPDRVEKFCCHPQSHFRDHPADRNAMPELAGPKEAAMILEVSTSRVWVLIKRMDFPKPVARLGCGPIWLAAEVRTFHESRRRTPGRAKSPGPCAT